MSQPGNVPPPIEPTPFGRAPERTPGRGGCAKPVMFGCAALLVLLGIGAILFMANAGRVASHLLRFSLGTLEKQIMANLPEDVTPEERERLRMAFASALAATSSGSFDPQRLPEVQSEIMQIARRPQGQITRQDVLDLTAALERVAAGAAPGTPPAEEPGEGAEPTEPTEPAPTEL